MCRFVKRVKWFIGVSCRVGEKGKKGFLFFFGLKNGERLLIGLGKGWKGFVGSVVGLGKG